MGVGAPEERAVFNKSDAAALEAGLAGLIGDAENGALLSLPPL